MQKEWQNVQDDVYAKYQCLLDNLRDIILFISKKGHIKDANGKALESYAYTHDEILKMNINELLAPGETVITEDIIKELTENRQVLNTFQCTKNGDKIDVEISMNRVEQKLDEVLIFCIIKQVPQYNSEMETKVMRQLIDNVLDVICIVNRNSVYEYASLSYKDLLGYEEEEILGKNMFEYLHPEDTTKIKEIIKRIENTCESECVEFRYRKKDGSYLWLESNANPVLNQKGDWIFTVMGTRDISERKKSEAMLWESEKKYSGLFDSMQESFALADIITDNEANPVGFKFIEVNSVFARNIGYPMSELIGSVLTQNSVVIEKYWWDLLFQVARTKQPCSYEGYFGYSDKYFEVFAFAPGENSIACLFVDVSRRIQAEKKLAEEKEWLNVTLESVNEGIIATGTDGKILFLNHIAAELLEWDEEKALTKSISDVFLSFQEEDDDLHLHSSRQLEPSVVMDDNNIIINRRGVKKILSNSAAPIRDKAGKVSGMVMVLSDVTEQRRVQEHIEYLSFTDTLTGLYNRAYIDNIRVELDKKNQIPLSFIMADLNSLKLVNDVFGHQEGDEVLLKAASVFKKCCRESDIVSRWGGDEFLLILPRTSNKVALQVCDRIRTVCKEINADPIELSVAMGTATRESCEQDLENLFKIAEDRMYSEKLLIARSQYNVFIDNLEKALWTRTDENEEHIKRIKGMAEDFADLLSMRNNEREKLLMLASLHDIGKVVGGDSDFTRMYKLNSEVPAEHIKHTEIGYRMAQAITQLKPIADGILYHHECWDGSGYPYGIKGEEIPLISRIIAIIHAYDDMIHNNLFSQEKAIKELKIKSGTDFDPNMLNIFVSYILKNKNNNY